MLQDLPSRDYSSKSSSSWGIEFRDTMSYHLKVSSIQGIQSGDLFSKGISSSVG
jgi:hypothetical protein